MAATTILSNGNGKEVYITKPSAEILKEFPFVQWSIQVRHKILIDNNNDTINRKTKLKKDIHHFIDFKQAQIFAQASLSL